VDLKQQYLSRVLEFRNDLPKYGAKCLKIRNKAGAIVSFVMNQAQTIAHGQLERQLQDTGKVRALVLKGRQQGMSTYVAGRYYRNTSLNRGKRTFILTHLTDATNTLFGIVNRYHEHNLPYFKPATATDNAKELVFRGLDSSYIVATAGSRSVGRSETIQYFHGSEVAFWPNASEHFAGVVQAIPNENGTEIILESTANGIGNKFHEMWQAAEKGESEYIAIFIPWFKQDEYRADVPHGLEFDEQEKEYARIYELDEAQLYWRRNKIAELGATLFKQEYPANPTEAFQNTGVESFIDPACVLRARKAPAIRRPHAPLVMGVDPAGRGKDWTVITFRQGATCITQERIKEPESMALVGLLARYLEGKGHGYGVPDIAFIDIGYNPGIYDRLIELGHKNIKPVNFGGAADDKIRYTNKRAEMYGLSNEWLNDPYDQASIPDCDLLHGDLCAPGRKNTSNGKLLLESKEDIKTRIKRSTDNGDSFILTFAGPALVKKGNTPHKRGMSYNQQATSYL
jgi:hypothetical protein